MKLTEHQMDVLRGLCEQPRKEWSLWFRPDWRALGRLADLGLAETHQRKDGLWRATPLGRTLIRAEHERSCVGGGRWICARCGATYRGQKHLSYAKQLPVGINDVRLGQPLCTKCSPNPSDSDVRCRRCGGVDAHQPTCSA